MFQEWEDAKALTLNHGSILCPPATALGLPTRFGYHTLIRTEVTVVHLHEGRERTAALLDEVAKQRPATDRVIEYLAVIRELPPAANGEIVSRMRLQHVANVKVRVPIVRRDRVVGALVGGAPCNEPQPEES